MRPGQAAAAPGISATLLAGLVDESGQPLVVFIRKVVLGHVEEGGDDVGGRAVEEGLLEMGEGALPGLVLGQPRRVDVAGAVLPVEEMTLLLENAEEGPDGRIARRRRQPLQDLKGRGL